MPRVIAPERTVKTALSNPTLTSPQSQIILVHESQMGFQDDLGSVTGTERKRKFLSLQLRILTWIGILVFFSFAPASQVSSLLVTNRSDAVNGDTSNPDALVNDPGPDGISLREAILAADAALKPLLISFDPSLKGAVIFVTDRLPPLTKGRLKIKGDIDNDGKPDITLDGGRGTAHDCFLVFASDVTIAGFTIRDIGWTGIIVAAFAEDGVSRVERVTLLGNTITVGWSGISIAASGSNRVVDNIDVLQNRLVNNGSIGINIDTAIGTSTNSNNRIANITIRNNTIAKNFIAIFASATRPNATNNVISDLEISNNTIQGQTDTSILISGANESKSQGNRIETLFIRNNYIQNPEGDCGIEVLGGVGKDAKDNHVSHATIEGNLIKEGSIMLVGGSTSGHDNGIDDILINRNKILNDLFNGFMIQGGSFGARNNTVEKIKVANTLIARSHGAGIVLLGGFDNSDNNTVRDVTLLNNTLAENGKTADWAGGINIQNDNNSVGNVVSGVKIANTILWKNRQNDRIAGSQRPASVRNCILGDARYRGSNGNFYLSPQFVAPAHTDYSLQATSPAIDMGATSGTDPGKFDLAGYPRGADGNGDGTAVMDIGAYERQKGGVRFHKLTIAADTHGRIDLGAGVYYVPAGTRLTLRALPKAGCKFRNWSGSISSLQNPLMITMNGPKKITANFDIITLTIRAGKGGTTNPH